MGFKERYTTESKRLEDSKKNHKDQTEIKKTVITNDAFALTEAIEKLSVNIERLRLAFFK